MEVLLRWMRVMLLDGDEDWRGVSAQEAILLAKLVEVGARREAGCAGRHNMAHQLLLRREAQAVALPEPAIGNQAASQQPVRVNVHRSIPKASIHRWKAFQEAPKLK